MISAPAFPGDGAKPQCGLRFSFQMLDIVNARSASLIDFARSELS
jgi:hypothetical protein